MKAPHVPVRYVSGAAEPRWGSLCSAAVGGLVEPSIFKMFVALGIHVVVYTPAGDSRQRVEVLVDFAAWA